VFDVHLGVQKQSTGKAPLQAAGLEGRHVLVVDDNSSSQEILVNMLQGSGLHMETAMRGDIALEMSMQAERIGKPYDIVLMDWRMPGMDGVQCAQKLRDLGLARPPAVIMVTSYGYDQAMGLTDGAPGLIRGVVVKPVIKSMLLAKMQASLDSSSVDRPALFNMFMESDKQAQAIAHLRGARILLTEDNEVNRELAVELFEYAGLNVVVAHHGQEALDILDKDQAFDGVLMDCQMPVMDGYTATRHIRSKPQLAAIPVIAMTANAMAGDKEAAIAAGMIDHISKPLDVEKMFVTMARWIRPTVRSVADRAAPKPQTESVTLPRIDGIDQAFGLRVSGGNKALYRRLLGKFATGNADFERAFQMALQDADRDAAMRCAHSLKGSAANLGIKGVETRALELELACKDVPDSLHIDALLQKVVAELAPVITALQDLASADLTQPAPLQADTQTGTALLLQLLDELADDDAQAQDTMRQLLATGTPLQQGLQELPALIENFEFKSALELLDSAA
jgi:CheY-like chemotaxis protein